MLLLRPLERRVVGFGASARLRGGSLTVLVRAMVEERKGGIEIGSGQEKAVGRHGGSF